MDYKKNKLIYSKTIWKNIVKISQSTKHWSSIKKVFKDFDPDLVITDFEPLTALLAQTQKKPLISVDNQHQLTRTKIKLPIKYKKDLIADKLVIKLMIRKANYYLITSFFKTPITHKNTFLFAPIIREEILDLKAKEEDYFLVYQGADFSNILPTLKNLKEKFIIFGPNKEGQEDNLTFIKYSLDEWLKYLANARAVIGTAGLSLISECIYLEKPYLALPIKNQIEQTINAEYLEKAELGMKAEKFTEKTFTIFLSKLDFYRKNLKLVEKCGNKDLNNKLEEIIKSLEKK